MKNEKVKKVEKIEKVENVEKVENETFNHNHKNYNSQHLHVHFKHIPYNNNLCGNATFYWRGVSMAVP